MFNVNDKKIKEIMADLIKVSKKAGDEILKVYGQDFKVDIKEDKSPLTEADRRSNDVITDYLKTLPYPILSEEGKQREYSFRKDWKSFFLVDPLDGTKEFVKRNGEFTVNIAGIEERNPVLGVIYVPVKDTYYFALKGHGAYRMDGTPEKDFEDMDFNSLCELSEKINTTFPDPEDKLIVVASRSHMSEETQDFIDDMKKNYSEVEVVSSGSSLKLCLVAEGKAHFYPRYAPTMEWDTGAGHAVVLEAGGNVYQHSRINTQLIYNKEDLVNPWFLVVPE